MTKKTRTIEGLRSSLEGKVYVRCRSEEAFRSFLRDAEAEGYLIGGRLPTRAGAAHDIMAVEYGRTLCTCGIVSHIACQAGADNVHIIDYERYVSDDTDSGIQSKKELTACNLTRWAI